MKHSERTGPRLGKLDDRIPGTPPTTHSEPTWPRLGKLDDRTLGTPPRRHPCA